MKQKLPWHSESLRITQQDKHPQHNFGPPWHKDLKSKKNEKINWEVWSSKFSDHFGCAFTSGCGTGVGSISKLVIVMAASKIRWWLARPHLSPGTVKEHQGTKETLAVFSTESTVTWLENPLFVAKFAIAKRGISITLSRSSEKKNKPIRTTSNDQLGNMSSLPIAKGWSRKPLQLHLCATPKQNPEMFVIASES